jgi:hypothetical protein
MDEERLWHDEERFWLEGAGAFGELMHPECIMAFGAPVGIMRGREIVESLKDAPRWHSVAMTSRSLSRPVEAIAVLAYQAEGHRAGNPPYSAYCTSTYVRSGDAWLMVQHQQTPAGSR